MMKSKPKFLLSLVFLLIHQTTPGECNIDESKVKSFVVTRRSQNLDLFTVNMKSNHRCNNTWCTLMEGFHISANGSSCSCTCHAPKFTFVPVMQIKRCIDASQAASFGGIRCAQAGYFNRQTLLNYPVVLTNNGKTKEFSVSNVVNCSGNYYVYDYTGFQDNWKTLTDNFFTIKVKRRSGFEIEWKKDDKGKYSGRIIRIVVTCTTTSSSLTRCILLKAVGPVTYSAPPASSSTNIGHSSPVGSHVSLLSATPSIVTKSSSLSVSLTVSPSSSSLLQTSASSPLSTTSMPSSLARSSSLLPYQPPSSSASSTLSPSLSPLPLPLPTPSLVLTSNTGTLGVPQSDSSFLPLTQSQTARLPAITTGQIQATTSAVIVPIEPAETTTTVSSRSAADGGPGNRGTQTGGNDNGVVIGATVGGAVVLGILVIIFIVFWKRRKAWESSENETKPVKNPVYGSSENAIQLEAPKESKTMPSIAQNNQPTYQSLIDDNGKSNEAAIYSSADDEYDNCTVYQSLDKQIPRTPVYGRLNKGLPEPAHTTDLPKPKPKAKTSVAGIPTSEANGVTGLPKPKPTTTGQPSNRPIVAHENAYNVLDGPGTGQGTTPEPMYNVLEGTDSGQDYKAPTVDPLYNVLEVPDPRQDIPKNGPSTKQDPLYNVLEGPDAKNAPINSHDPRNDPLYNVLEGPEASHDTFEVGAHTTQEPLYNVLDGPDAEKSLLVTQGTAGPSNEPLYNVLDGPDSDGSKQGAPKEPISPEAHDNPAYEQTLAFDAPYAAVHSPGMQRESVYEPLRGPGQDLYESIG